MGHMVEDSKNNIDLAFLLALTVWGSIYDKLTKIISSLNTELMTMANGKLTFKGFINYDCFLISLS